jgi:hypothetical protein
MPAYPLDGPGPIDGDEELATDVGDTRIGIVSAPPIHARAQDKQR